MVNSVSVINAESIKVNLANYSWGLFCFTQSGELFLHSEWGFFAANWAPRSFQNFKRFLIGYPSYNLVQAFEMNYRKVSGKNLSSQCRESLEVLSAEFIQTLKNETELSKSCYGI